MHLIRILLTTLFVGLIQAITTDNPSNLDKAIPKDCFNHDCPSQTVLCKRRTALSKDKKFVQEKITCLDKHGRAILSSFNKSDNVDTNVTFGSISIGMAKNKTSTSSDQGSTSAFSVTSTVATVDNNSSSFNGSNTTSNSSGSTDSTSENSTLQNSTDNSTNAPNIRDNSDTSTITTASKDNGTSIFTTNSSSSDSSTQATDKNSTTSENTSGDTGRDNSTSQPIIVNNSTASKV